MPPNRVSVFAEARLGRRSGHGIIYIKFYISYNSCMAQRIYCYSPCM